MGREDGALLGEGEAQLSRFAATDQAAAETGKLGIFTMPSFFTMD